MSCPIGIKNCKREQENLNDTCLICCMNKLIKVKKVVKKFRDLCNININKFSTSNLETMTLDKVPTSTLEYRGSISMGECVSDTSGNLWVFNGNGFVKYN